MGLIRSPFYSVFAMNEELVDPENPMRNLLADVGVD